MAKKLLKVAAVINLVLGCLGVLMSGLLIRSTWFAILGFMGLGFAAIKMALGGIYFGVSTKNGEEFIRKRNYVLTASIISMLTGGIISFILGIVAYTDMPETKGTDSFNERSIKHELTPEEREQKRLNNLLALGCGLVILAGIIFAVTTWTTLTGIYKTVALIIFSVIFLGMSYFSENKFKLKTSSITYYILANTFTVFAFISAGYFRVFGEWFSLNGAGADAYKVFLCFLFAVLSYVAYMKYSQKDLFYIVDFSLFIGLAYLFSFLKVPNDISLFILVCILSIFSLVNFSGEIIKRAKVLANVLLPFTLFSVFLNIATFDLGNRLVFDLLSFGVGFITVYYLAIVNKNMFYEIFAPIFTTVTSFTLSVVTNDSDKIIFLQLILISIIVYAIGQYKKGNEGLYNSSLVVCDFALLYVLVDALNMSYTYYAIISAVILLGVSLSVSINKEAGKYHFEKIIEPIKVVLLAYTIYKLFYKWDYIEESLFTALVASIFAFICLFRKNLIKNIYFGASIIISIVMVIFSINNAEPIAEILSVITCSILLLAVFKDEKLEKCKELAFGLTLLSIAFACSGIFGKYHLEILGIILLTVIYAIIFLFSNKNDVFRCFTITALLIPYTTILPISIWNDNINYILYSLPWLALIFIYTRGFLASANEKTVNTIEIVTLSIWFLAASSRVAPEVAIFIGVLSFIWLLVGYKNEKWFSLYYTGIAFLIINTIFQLKEFWTSIPVWAYILLAGLILIGIVTYKEYYKVNKKDKIEVEVVEAPESSIVKKEIDNRSIISGSILYLVIIALLFNII